MPDSVGATGTQLGKVDEDAYGRQTRGPGEAGHWGGEEESERRQGTGGRGERGEVGEEESEGKQERRRARGGRALRRRGGEQGEAGEEESEGHTGRVAR